MPSVCRAHNSEPNAFAPLCRLSAEQYEAEKERREAAEAAEEERIIETRRALARVTAAHNKQLEAELFLSRSRRVRSVRRSATPTSNKIPTSNNLWTNNNNNNSPSLRTAIILVYILHVLNKRFASSGVLRL